MIEVLDGVTNTNRFDVNVVTGVIVSGIQGLWVAPTSSGYNFENNAAVAYAIWTESKKDGSAGFTEDAKYLKKVAVLGGSYRALTDQFEGTPSVGSLLKTKNNGKLVEASANENVVAVVTKGVHTISHLGSNISVIEIQTAFRKV